MPLFRRRRDHDPTEITLDPQVAINNRSDVLETIDSLSIPRDKLIITGSSVLSLLGLPRRANDVDGILDPDMLKELHENKMLPSGVPVTEPPYSRAERRHFNAATTPLSSELFSHRDNLSDRKFNEFLEEESIPLSDYGNIVDITGVPPDLRITRLSDLFVRKRGRIYIGTPEQQRTKRAHDDYDCRLISDLGKLARGE